MRKIDVIIILGGGIDDQGEISKVTKERLDRFLKENNKFADALILLSGRWGGLAKLARGMPEITEAQAMKEYLITKGINSKRICLEMKSLDTVSNAVFSKEIIERHKGWSKILLITSDWHMKRALWIFQKVFGRQYQIHTFSVTSDKKSDDRKVCENYLLVVAKIILRFILIVNRLGSYFKRLLLRGKKYETENHNC